MFHKVVMTWEWIAGFFEGEGHVYWQEKGKRHGIGGRAIMGQVCKDPLQGIYDFLIAQGFEKPAFYLRPVARSARVNSRPCWMLTIQKRRDVIRFFESVAPLLFDKRAKAEYVIARLKAADAERERVVDEAVTLRQQGLAWREIARRTDIARTGLIAHLNARGIDWKQKPGLSDMEWRDDRIARGLCESCGNLRGEDGLKRKCRPCADRYNAWRRHWKARKKLRLVA